MNFTDITESASTLTFSQSTIEEYMTKQQQILAEQHRFFSKINDNWVTENITMITTNHINHSNFIAAILKNYSGKVLVETYLWALKTYQAHSLPKKYWKQQFNGWRYALTKIMSPHASQEIIQLYNWLETHLDSLFILAQQQHEKYTSVVDTK